MQPAAWTRDDARREMRRYDDALTAALHGAEQKGHILADVAVVFAQEPEGRARLQVWDRARLLLAEMRELIDDCAPFIEQDGAPRVPVLLWSLDGSMWITWLKVLSLARGGAA